MRLVIVDDEAPARASLRAALAGIPLELEVVGEAESTADAVRLLNKVRPEVVLLDIWLGDGTGFDVLDQLTHNGTRVIFITAFDQYAVRAFKSGALHYLLKPVVRADLQEALERAAQEPALGAERLQALRRALLDRITIPTMEGFHILSPDEILRCESDGNYTHFYLNNGEHMMASRTLKEFEEQLVPFGFMRVHLSHVVNLAQVRKYLHRDGGLLVLQDGQQVPVSQRKRQEVLEVLGRKAQ